MSQAGRSRHLYNILPVTILAFIYVPLNLATSIFGMNLEQLNGSGQHFSVFITTAIVALAVTGGTWFLIEQVPGYRKWRRRSTKEVEQYNGETRFTLVVRLAMLAYLVHHRNSQWMFKSGAWWRILVDHRSRICGHVLESDCWTAGEYVSKYSKESHTGDFFSVQRTIYWIYPAEEDE